MNNILQFQPKLNYTASDFKVRVSVSEKKLSNYYQYTATFYIKTTATDLTPTTEINLGELMVYSLDSSGQAQTFTASFNHNSGEQITVTCLGALRINGYANITIKSVSHKQFFDGHLTTKSFIITPHIRDDGIDEGEYYYSYSARVDINPDLDSFFMTKYIDTSGSQSAYGPVEYSTSVTFKTKKEEEITVYFTLKGTGGPNASCSATVNGISPQWIDTPWRPRLLKYGNKLIKINMPIFYIWANEGGYHFADGTDPHPFFYEPGMTWRQWVASAYNPAPESIYIGGNNILFNAPYIIEGSSAIQDGVKPDDVIDPNHHYWLSDE